MLKYNLFEKRDGGMISCLKKEDESIVPNQGICTSLHLKNKHGIIVKDILKI